jgi:cold shock CspA family protein
MEERKANGAKGRPLEEMMAYVDEDGNLTSSPPDPEKKKVFNVEDIEIGVPKFQAQDDQPMEGRVDYFDASKGFGFIIQNTGLKIFFHISQATYPVNEGDIVNFTVERGPKGLKAVGVAKKQ